MKYYGDNTFNLNSLLKRKGLLSLIVNEGTLN